jgi:hypothetical protein
MSSTPSPTENRRAAKTLLKISQQEADERAESYVKSVLAEIKPENLELAELSSAEIAYSMRQRFYSFLAANYEVVA